MGNNDNCRLIWVDWAKAISIYLMILGHTWAPSIVINMISAFNMPLFLILSGYLFNLNNTNRNILRQILSLIIPVLVVSLINIVCDLFGGVNWNLIRADFDRWHYKFMGIWFVETIIMFRIIMFLPLVKKNYAIIGAVCCFVVGILDYNKIVVEPLLGDSMLIECFPFLALGIFLRQHSISFFVQSKSLLLVISIIFVFVTFFFGGVNMRVGEFCHGYLLFFINSLLGCFVFVNFCNLLGQSNIVETISKGTIFILGFHYTIFLVLMWRLTPGVIIDYVWLPYSIVILVLCYPFILFSLKYCPWIVGRLKK